MKRNATFSAHSGGMHRREARIPSSRGHTPHLVSFSESGRRMSRFTSAHVGPIAQNGGAPARESHKRSPPTCGGPRIVRREPRRSRHAGGKTYRAEPATSFIRAAASTSAPSAIGACRRPGRQTGRLVGIGANVTRKTLQQKEWSFRGV